MAGRHALPVAEPPRRSQQQSFGPQRRRSTFTEIASQAPTRRSVRASLRSVEAAIPDRTAEIAVPKRVAQAAAPDRTAEASVQNRVAAVAVPNRLQAVAPRAQVLARAPKASALRSRKEIRIECARRVKHAKRLAHVLAPLMAVTSGLGFALPANASSLHESPSAAATASADAQHFQVSSGVSVPVIENGQATVISTPTLVVGWGTSVAQAKVVVTNDLSDGGVRAKIIDTALSYLGDPYVEGGASHSGIDCSGLVMVAYASVGIQLAHYVPTQDAVATTIPASEALPGDLVVYDSEAHIGIYLGGGLVLQAPHPGEPVDIIGMFPAPHHFARILPAGA